MKTLAGTLSLLASASVASAFTLIPNGDFSTPAGDSWNFAGGAVTFETTGGNGGGFGKIDANGGAWGGVLVGEGGTGPAPAGGDGIPLATLGIAPGETVTFQWDQIDLGGNGALAGIKLESWAAGAFLDNGAGDILVATNDMWTTESTSYTINPSADAIKIVMIQNTGTGNTGFDNIGIVPEPSSSLLVGLGALGLLARRRRN